jgi:hypothetical protein
MERRALRATVATSVATAVTVAVAPMPAAANFQQTVMPVPPGSIHYGLERTTGGGGVGDVFWKFSEWPNATGDISVRMVHCQTGGYISGGSTFKAAHERKAIGTDIFSGTCFQIGSLSSFNQSYNLDAAIWWPPY